MRHFPLTNESFTPVIFWKLQKFAVKDDIKCSNQTHNFGSAENSLYQSVFIIPFHVVYLMKDSVGHCYLIVVLGNCNANQLQQKKMRIGNDEQREERQREEINGIAWIFFPLSKKEVKKQESCILVYSRVHMNTEISRCRINVNLTRKRKQFYQFVLTHLFDVYSTVDDGYANKRWFVLTFYIRFCEQISVLFCIPFELTKHESMEIQRCAPVDNSREWMHHRHSHSNEIHFQWELFAKITCTHTHTHINSHLNNPPTESLRALHV